MSKNHKGSKREANLAQRRKAAKDCIPMAIKRRKNARTTKVSEVRLARERLLTLDRKKVITHAAMMKRYGRLRTE
jgi:hypothetical protein